MSARSRFETRSLIAIPLLVLLAGCGGGEYGHGDSHGDAAAQDPAQSGAEALAVVELTAEAEAVLAVADLADGTEDHVVAKCPGCNLAMDGSADHAAHVGDYELHFCSEDCSRRFQEDTIASVMALDKP